MIPVVRTVAIGSMTTVGFLSSCTYLVQAVVQIKRHGVRTWVEAGFNQLADLVDEGIEAVEEEVL